MKKGCRHKINLDLNDLHPLWTGVGINRSQRQLCKCPYIIHLPTMPPRPVPHNSSGQTHASATALAARRSRFISCRSTDNSARTDVWDSSSDEIDSLRGDTMECSGDQKARAKIASNKLPVVPRKVKKPRINGINNQASSTTQQRSAFTMVWRSANIITTVSEEK